MAAHAIHSSAVPPPGFTEIPFKIRVITGRRASHSDLGSLLTWRWNNAGGCLRKLCLLLVLEYWKVFLVLPDYRAAIHYIRLLLWGKKKQVLAHSITDGHLRSAKWEMDAIPNLAAVVPQPCLESSTLGLTTSSVKKQPPPHKWGLGSKIRPQNRTSLTIQRKQVHFGFRGVQS